MLLALPNFGLERMGRNPPGGYAGKIYLARYARKTQNPKPKTQNPKPKTQNPKKYSGRRPQKSIQIAAVFPGPIGPARR